ncbi:MAG: hypothetical protein JW825_01315 [Candidatus Methanofastidiosa archaeon]|nr:hypothetical protein [Candidatus Methanofastidiosa archaeon]
MVERAENKEEYKDVSFILGLKVTPGKENDIRAKAETMPEVFRSFKSLGQFDVILLIKGTEDADALMKTLRNTQYILDVYLIDLE